MSPSKVSPKWVLGTILVGLLSWGLYSSIEFYDEMVQSSWTLDAIRNPYLAAQQFLTQSEVDVIEADSLVNLESLTGVGTLFISDANQVVTPRQLRQVLDWLQTGGSVIYTASSITHEDDLLLAEFDVEVDWRDYDSEEDTEEKPLSESFREYNRQIEEGKSREEIARGFAGENSLTVIEFDDDIGNLEVAFNDNKVLLHPYIVGTGYEPSKPQPRNWSYSDYGIHMMQFDVGDGLLTIISDPTVWTSYRIDQHDHAYFLWILSSAGGRFAILRPVLQDSLWQLTMKYATELLLAIGLLIAIWIWHLAYRFGRMVPRDLSHTRALGEHFSSISHYLWHRRHGEYLISPLRHRVLRRASLLMGEFSRASHERQMEMLAERCDRTSSSISKAMNETEFNEAGFVNTVKLLKHIEQSL